MGGEENEKGGGRGESCRSFHTPYSLPGLGCMKMSLKATTLSYFLAVRSSFNIFIRAGTLWLSHLLERRGICFFFVFCMSQGLPLVYSMRSVFSSLWVPKGILALSLWRREFGFRVFYLLTFLLFHIHFREFLSSLSINLQGYELQEVNCFSVRRIF